MCGEMAGDQQAVPLLVGMGLDEFSMSATSVLRTRSLMKKLDTAKMEEYANRALTECSTMEEVLELQKNTLILINRKVPATQLQGFFDILKEFSRKSFL